LINQLLTYLLPAGGGEGGGALLLTALTRLLTYLFTYILTYVLTYLKTYLDTCLLIYCRPEEGGEAAGGVRLTSGEFLQVSKYVGKLGSR